MFAALGSVANISICGGMPAEFFNVFTKQNLAQIPYRFIRILFFLKKPE
jgi:hypothetical protein